MKIVIMGEPKTKKNSQRIVMCGRFPKIMPSKAYCEYEKTAVWQLAGHRVGIDKRVNVQCRYYMKTKRKVDLVNLLEATDDILVKAGVLLDDNSNIIASHDGSRVLLDRLCPRVEIEINEETSEHLSQV